MCAYREHFGVAISPYFHVYNRYSTPARIPTTQAGSQPRAFTSTFVLHDPRATLGTTNCALSPRVLTIDANPHQSERWDVSIFSLNTATVNLSLAKVGNEHGTSYGRFWLSQRTDGEALQSHVGYASNDIEESSFKPR